MIAGNPEVWLGQLKNVHSILLDMIVARWCDYIRTNDLSNQKEDEVTEAIYRLVKSEKRNRNIFSWHLSIFHTVLEGSSKGIIDLAVLLGSEDMYIGYECKWLCKKGQESNLYSKYTGLEGMGCFLNEKYGAFSPFGCMIGYINSGEIASCRTGLEKRLVNKKNQLSLNDGPRNLPDIGFLQHFETIHNRSTGSSLLIEHVMLPVSCIK